MFSLAGLDGGPGALSLDPSAPLRAGSRGRSSPHCRPRKCEGLGGRLAPSLFFCGAVMLSPVGSVASTVEGDLGEEEFGGQAALGEVSGDSLLRRFR